MNPVVLFSVVLVYFLVLLVVAYYTSRNSNNDSFFIGNKSSNWMLVAFGMIGTSLSGVTFVSVPGTVGPSGFAYFQVVIGYLIGYLVIAYVLLPLYYRLNLTSIYNYLLQRFGITSYKTGALFFIISRTLGATARLYLVINVLQIFILDRMGVSFEVTTLIILFMILLYTFKGGVKTIVWTDTLQTTCMLLGLIVCVLFIMNSLGLSFSDTVTAIGEKGYTRIFNTDINAPGFFLKEIIGGAFITIAMTGLDQEMMQKNISVRTLKDSQKNMVTFSVIIVFVNLLFLFLGGLLYLFAESKGITVPKDDVFPTIALQYLPEIVGIIFIVGLISALFPSADGAITALTSSFCIDILGIKRKNVITTSPDQDNPAILEDEVNSMERERKGVRTRQIVHLSFAVIFMVCVMIFKYIDNKSIIGVILKVAGYTYGPLLGLFAFGILTKRKLADRWVPIVCLASPALCYLIEMNQSKLLGNFQIGIELLILNGVITFIGLLLISKRDAAHQAL
jgi:Na+/proline symporter